MQENQSETSTKIESQSEERGEHPARHFLEGFSLWTRHFYQVYWPNFIIGIITFFCLLLVTLLMNTVKLAIYGLGIGACLLASLAIMSFTHFIAKHYSKSANIEERQSSPATPPSLSSVAKPEESQAPTSSPGVLPTQTPKQVDKQLRNQSHKNAALSNAERAWVMVEGADCEPLQVGSKVSVRLTFANSGKTPAFNVVTNTAINFQRNPVPFPMPFQRSPDASKSTLQPGGSRMIIATHAITLTQTMLNELLQGTLRIYVWGRIEYDDIQGKPHMTEFCMAHRIGTNLFDACPNNNTAN